MGSTMHVSVMCSSSSSLRVRVWLLAVVVAVHRFSLRPVQVFISVEAVSSNVDLHMNVRVPVWEAGTQARLAQAVTSKATTIMASRVRAMTLLPGTRVQQVFSLAVLLVLVEAVVRASGIPTLSEEWAEKGHSDILKSLTANYGERIHEHRGSSPGKQE